MDRCIAKAAGGINQRLNSFGAMIRVREKNFVGVGADVDVDIDVVDDVDVVEDEDAEDGEVSDAMGSP